MPGVALHPPAQYTIRHTWLCADSTLLPSRNFSMFCLGLVKTRQEEKVKFPNVASGQLCSLHPACLPSSCPYSTLRPTHGFSFQRAYFDALLILLNTPQALSSCYHQALIGPMFRDKSRPPFFQSKNLCCRYQKFKQGFWSIKLEQNCHFRVCFCNICIEKNQNKTHFEKVT